MQALLIMVIIFLSLLVGSFGFSQIVGTIKFFRYFPKGQALFTIVLWSAILGFAAFAVIKWLNDYKVALYIGYGVSFLLSLNTKPD